MKNELDLYIRARYPLLWVVTSEEERALGEIEAVAKSQRKRMWVWSMTTGLANVALPNQADKTKRDPLALLSSVLDEAEAGLWVLRDFHPFLKDAGIVRRLREVAQGIQTSQKTVILLGPVLAIPPELEKEVTVLDLPLPDGPQLTATIDGMLDAAQRNGEIDIALDRRQRARLVQACLGLTESEASNAIAKAIVQTGGRLDGAAIEAVMAEKQQIIRKSGLLEFYASDERLGSSVGGLDVLKEWLRKRVRAFSDEARAFGLPEPKGILLVGVQGCGKSLVAKSVANTWKLPLLRLDVGRLFSSLVGSSEENLRGAIRVAESIAPVVLWVDEIEKGFSGVGGGMSDAGTAARVFGSFITWLQEKQSPVFVIATANNVAQLPPELVRKGRFDEIFFVDLPSAEERTQIWRIHLLKRNRDPDAFDLGSLAMASDGLSGAEIEQAVIAGLYEAFDKNRPLEMDDLLEVLHDTVPLSRMMEEQIAGLRAWAKQRARQASG